MEINIQNAIKSIPLCRKDLFIDVVHNKVYGDIKQIWQFQGHILITIKDGQQLLTFDCKPLQQQHVFDSKCLDMTAVPDLIVDVLMLSPHMFALVDTVGKMMFWKFTPEFTWVHEGDVQLSTSTNSEIISVTYIQGCNTVVWCEKQPIELPARQSSSFSSIFCICKMQLCSDLDHQKISEMSWPSIFIQECPPCDIYTISSNCLFISTQFDSKQVSIHLVFDFAKNLLSLFIGGQCINYPVTLSHETLDFQEVLMACLSVLIKTKPGQGDLGVRSDSCTGQVAVLSSGGEMEVYSLTSDSGKSQLSKKVITLLCEDGSTYKVDTKHWFLYRGHVGVVHDNSVYIFRAEDGKHVCKYKSDTIKNVQALIKSTLPIFFTWILTSRQLLALQGIETKSKQMYTSADKLPDDNLLQTDILRLAHLHELRLSGSTHTVIKDLSNLHQKWTEMKNLSHHTPISNILAPYLAEYWRLEKLCQVLLDSENKSMIPPLMNCAIDTVNVHMESKSCTKTEQHAKLMWMSQVHPKELLDYLCHGISLENNVIHPSEMKKWQIILGLEGGNLLNFECVCRLLFTIMPQNLLNFVKCAESVDEQTSGASAFVRKKQNLMYYKTAWECLPHSKTSCDSKTAASVKAKLILASETENCVEGALTCLLGHGLWSQAIDLLREQIGTQGLPAYLHITIKTLAENNVLSDYTTDLIAIMPSWKSLISFSQLVAERPDIRQQQLSCLAKDVFVTGSSNIQLGDVRQLLLNLILK